MTPAGLKVNFFAWKVVEKFKPLWGNIYGVRVRSGTQVSVPGWRRGGCLGRSAEAKLSFVDYALVIVIVVLMVDGQDDQK